MPAKKKAKAKSARRIPKPKPTEPKTSKAERDKAQAARLRILFNTTPSEKAAVLAFQENVCYVKKVNTNKKGEPLLLSLDHCHKTGKLRGFLHPLINKGLKFFEDNPELLERAAEYLRNPPYTRVAGEDVYGVQGRVTNKAKGRKYGPLGTKEPQPRSIFAQKEKVTA